MRIGTALSNSATKALLLGSGELGKELVISLQRYGPWNWGTGEIQAYTCSTDNLFQDGQNLNIRALHSDHGWTSGRIETVRQDFQPNPNGILAVEARIKLPEVNNTNGLGYWPAFWMLGDGYRKDYWSWPRVGEIDIMENVNGLNRWWGVLHCGPVDYNRPGQINPCNEPKGIAGDVSGFNPALQSTFHTYRLEFDKTVSHQQLRWYVGRCAITSLARSWSAYRILA